MARVDSHRRQSARHRGRKIPERGTAFPVVNFRPVKPRAYGSTKAVVAEAFDQMGGVERVKVILDLGKTQTYGFTDPEARGSDLSLDAARRLTEITHANTFACDFAQLAGGIFLKPDSLADGEALADLGGDISKSIADLVADLLTAIWDGTVTERERVDLMRRCDIGTAAMLALRARLMDGGEA